MELFNEWKEEEIEEYKKIRNKEIEYMYKLFGIPEDKPKERAKCLNETLHFSLHFPWVTYELVEKIVFEEGKAKALQFLENIAAKIFV
jgi:hypothetical protein